MGHNRLPRLPATRPWQEVVALLQAEPVAQEVISAAAHAARHSFTYAVEDAVYAEAVRLLVVIARAARSDNFTVELRRNGILVDQAPDLISFLDATGRRLDTVLSASSEPSDFGALARRAVLGSLYSELGREMPSLFAEGAEVLELAARKFSSPRGFSELARAFYTRMTAETLTYWLDRTLGAQIGTARAFNNIEDRTDFDAAVQQFSSEATRIIKEFSEGWYAKNALRDGFDPSAAPRAYAATAFKKINDELRRKVGSDA